MPLEIPVNSSGSRSIRVDLGVRVVSIRTYYNTIARQWFMDLMDDQERPIALGLAMNPNINMLEWSPTLTRQIGQFRVVVTSGFNNAPDSLGSSAFLIYYTPGEFEGLYPNFDTPRLIPLAYDFNSIVRSEFDPAPDFWLPLRRNLNVFNGTGTPTFTRSTTKTYTDPSGVLRTAAINEAAFESQGILIEGSNTNLITDNRNLTPRSILSAGTASFVTGTAPSGQSENLQRLESDETQAVSGIRESFQPVSNTDYTFSVWIRSESGSINVRLVYSNFDEWNSVPEETFTITDEWQRVSITRTNTSAAPGAGFVNVLVRSDENTGPVSFLTTYWQLESLPFATSYIPTLGTAVTRAADVPRLDPSVLPDGEFTISVTASIMGFQNDFPRVWDFRDTANNQNIHLAHYRSPGSFTFQSGSSQQATETLQDITSEKVFVSSAGNHYVDGVLFGRTTFSNSATGTMTLSLGDQFSGGRNLYGHIKDVRIWNRALTAAEVAAIS